MAVSGQLLDGFFLNEKTIETTIIFLQNGEIS